MQKGSKSTPWRDMDDTQRLVALRAAENHLWLCEGRGEADHATLVIGWSSVIRLLAKERLDGETPPHAIAEAEAWLLRDAEEWSFGPNGTAYWSVTFEDGGWAATLVTDHSAVTFPLLSMRH